MELLEPYAYDASAKDVTIRGSTFAPRSIRRR